MELMKDMGIWAIDDSSPLVYDNQDNRMVSSMQNLFEKVKKFYQSLNAQAL